MLMHLIKKEILEHMMSLRFAIACVLCFTVILASLFVRGQDFRIVSADFREESQSFKHDMENMNHPWMIVWRGIVAGQTPNPLKVFVRGVDDGNGVSVRVNAHQALQPQAADERDPLAHLFQSMDLVNFIGIVMSLMAIVFGYDAICGEKERGTLRLMLSYSVPRDKLLLAKWIGGYTSLVVPFLLAVLCGAAIVLVQSDFSLSGAQWLQLAGLLFVALAYIAAMYWMAIWVSCMTDRPATSVLVLATAWMILVLVIPNLSPYIARSIHPTRNPLEVEIAGATARNAIWEREVAEKMNAYDKANNLEAGWWEKIDRSKWDQRVIGERRRVQELKYEAAANQARLEAYGRLDEEFQRELDGQVALSRWISRISPFSCLSLVASELTDTGATSKRRFMDQLRIYQRTLAKYGGDEWVAMNQYRIDNGGKGKQWSELRLKPVPGFVYVPPAGSQYLRGIVVEGGIIIGAAILFFMLSYMSFLRYDVR